MTREIYILDIIGTFAFAVYGSYYALEKKFDIFGISVCASITALWWGTIREIIMGNVPFYFFDMTYIGAIILAIACAIIIHKQFNTFNTIFLGIDALWLVTFAFIGASKGSDIWLGIFGITVFATLTAVGWWVIRDIILNKIPEIMYRNIYASIAIVLWIIYWLTKEYMDQKIRANLLIIFCLCIKYITMYYKIDLRKPNTKKD